MQMKITYINVSTDEKSAVVSLTLDLDDLDLVSAVQKVLARFEGKEVSHDASSSPTLTPAASSGQEPASASTEPGPSRRTRQPRNAPPADAAPQDQPANEAPAGRRRRVAEVPPAAEGPKVYSDVDLSKAASLAAEALTKLGDNGPEVVKLVLADLGVTTTNDIPADKREKFLADLAEEVMLAEAEKKAAA